MLKQADLQKKKHFNRSTIVPALREAGQDKLADKIVDCAEWSDIAICKSCGTKYYAGSGYCKSRFCSICAKLRALAWLAKLVPLLKDYIRRGHMVFMLNLTIKNQPDLDRGLRVLGDAWRHMTHDDKASRAAFRSLNCGGVRSTEIKIGAGSGIWHPHIHSIVLCKIERGRRVKQFEQYRELWERAVRSAFDCADGADKLGSVDIRGIRDYNGEKGLLSAVVETFKYIAKFTWLDLPPARVRELIQTTRGKHFVSAWGVLYGLNKQVEALLAQSTEQELKAHVCAVCGCNEFELEHVLTDIMPNEHANDFTA